MVYQLKTKVSIEEVSSSIDEKAKEFGFGVLKTYEFKDILQSRGFDFDKEVFVYELCNPAIAKEILELAPEMSTYLPCRLSLYKDGNLSVLSTINIDDILSSVNIEDNLKLKIEEIFEQLKKLINSWK